MTKMVHIPALAVALLVLSVLYPSCSAYGLEWDPYAELASPENWDALRPGQSLMFSGTDPGGKNMDSGNFLRIEPEGAGFQEGDWVLAEMDGPGSITRIWVTGKNHEGEGAKIYGRIKIYIDSRDKPVVDLPIEDFFGRAAPFVPPLATATSGGWVSYVPIPFSTYCKVVVTDHQDRYAHRVNGLGQTIPHLYYQINWRKMPSGTQVEPFSMRLSDERKELIRKAVAAFDWNPATSRQSIMIGPKRTTHIWGVPGSGRITEIVLAAPDVEGLRLLAYWDGSETPAIDVPARMFFAEGLTPRSFTSLPLLVDSGLRAARFPMPFADGARLCLRNTGNCFVTVGVGVTMEEGPVTTPLRFHARYVDQKVAAGDPDIVVLDTKNGPGHFIGAAMLTPENFLEGNETIIVDGGKRGWVGTGTEDYFNGGWYFSAGPFDQPFAGCVHLGRYAMAYRFHLTDAVPFSNSIKVTLQHGGENEEAGWARGAAYWYESVK